MRDEKFPLVLHHPSYEEIHTGYSHEKCWKLKMLPRESFQLDTGAVPFGDETDA